MSGSTGSDLAFDGLAKLATTTLRVPSARVCFAGFDRQWFDTRYGVDAPELPRDVALLCGQVVATGETLVVPDTSKDSRLSAEPPMIGDRPARFCAGVPLRTPGGIVFGAFCVADHEPRTLTGVEMETLALLAGQVVELMELRRGPATTDRSPRDEHDGEGAEKAKTEFVSLVSHELRTPLTTIRGALGLVAKGVTGALPQQAQECVDIALANSERLVGLINDILDIEKIQSGTVELDLRPVSLVSLIEKAVRGSRALADSLDITLNIADQTSDIEVMVDEYRLVQVLERLISNAAKFSRAGQSVELSMVRDGDRVRVEVRDHGRGISKEFRTRVFERFAQEDSSTTREKGGTGLSLHIAKALVEGMNGAMSFESAPGAGTAFFVELPVARRADSDPVAKPPVHKDRGGGTVRDPHSVPRRKPAPVQVLYVEDDQDLQQIVRRLMPVEWAFTGATTVADGRAALDAQPFDLVLLDLILPDGDGATLLDHVGAAKVVVFSAAEAAPALVGRVTSALVKSRTSEFQLRDHVVDLISAHDAQRTSP